MAVQRLYSYGFAIPRSSGSAWDLSEQKMLEDLARSGLVPEDILAYPQAINLPPKANAGYVIPYYGLDGNYLATREAGVSNQMFRMRLFYPMTLPKMELRKLPKYWQLPRSQLAEMASIPYILPVWWKQKGGARFLVEGEKKAAAVWKHWGVPTIGIGGCSNWSNPVNDEEHPLHPWIEEAVRRQEIERLIIIPDGDIKRFTINHEYRGLADALIALGIEVEIINFSELKPSKVDDWLVAHPGVGVEAITDWPLFDINEMAENREQLIRRYNLLVEQRARGAAVIIANEHNIMSLFDFHPTWQGAFRYNLDTNKIVGKLGGRPYNETSTVIDISNILQAVFHIQKVPRSMVRACLAATAEHHKISPRSFWLENTVWDGKPRLATMFTTCCSAVDSRYHREVAVKSLVAAVARTFEPGCMVDYMVILHGPQGVGKSGFIKALFGTENTYEYTRGNAEGKDWLLAAHSKWVVSDEELGSMRGSDLNRLKGQITIRTDVFRAPYAAEVESHPRKFVWWGSTNDEEFLPPDHTGQRRYAVVRVGQVNFKLVESMREQLWAEAVQIYRDSTTGMAEVNPDGSIGKLVEGEMSGDGVDYSNIKGTSEAVQQYIMGNDIQEQIEDILNHGKPMYCEHLGIQRRWIRTNHILGQMRNPSSGSWYMREIANALRALGFVKVNQKHIDGKHYNAVWVHIP